MGRSNKFHRDKTKILHHKVIQTDVKKKSAFSNMNKATLTNFSLEKPLSNNHHFKTVFPSSFSPQLEILGRVFISSRLSPLLRSWNVLDLQHLNYFFFIFFSYIFIFIQSMSCDNSFK